MSEDFLPRRPGGSRCLADPKRVRVKEPSQQFGCVMAQYHFQHELPPTALARSGILGNLLSSAQGVRFLSGLEATFLHGLIRPYHLAQADRLQMQQIGNSLAVPQAALALVHCMQAAQEVCVAPLLTPVLQRCLELRTHARNYVLLPAPEGHVVCQSCQVAEVVQHWAPLRFHGQISQQCDMMFRGYKVVDNDSTLCLCLPPPLSIAQALSRLQLDAPPVEVESAASLPLGSANLALCHWHSLPAIPVATLPPLDYVVDCFSLTLRTLCRSLLYGHLGPSLSRCRVGSSTGLLTFSLNRSFRPQGGKFFGVALISSPPCRSGPVVQAHVSLKGKS